MDLAQDVLAILQVILLDLSLGGDNSIVIGMAAKGLPEKHQKKVIIFGAAGAVIARFLLAAIIVWLLSVPYLKTIGGIILVWIGMKLIGEEDTGDDEDVHVEAKTTFWGAVETIVLADFIMSLDNVLAIVAATNENLELLVAGMLISVPIIMLGSTIVVKIMDKFPQIIYIGAVVIGWAAGGMMVTDPHLGLPEEWALYVKVGVTLLVAVGGWVWQHMGRIKKNNNRRNKPKGTGDGAADVDAAAE